MSETCLPQEVGNILVETERLLIRRPEEGDARRLDGLFCDPAMMRYLGGPWNQDQVTEAFQEWRSDWGVKNRWYGSLADIY